MYIRDSRELGVGRAEVPVRAKVSNGSTPGGEVMKKSTTKLAKKAQLSVGPSGMRAHSPMGDENGRSMLVKKVKKVSARPSDESGRPTAPMNHGRTNSADERSRLPMAWGTPSFDGPATGSKLTRSRTMPSKAGAGKVGATGNSGGLRPRSASASGPQDIHGAQGHSVMAHRSSLDRGSAAPVLATQRRSLMRSSSAPADRGPAAAPAGTYLQKTAHVSNPGLVGSWSKRAHSAPAYSKVNGQVTGSRGVQPRLSVAGSTLEGRSARPTSAGHAAGSIHYHQGGAGGSPPSVEAAEAAAQRAMRRAERLLALQHADKDKLHVAVLELQAAQRDLAARSGSPEAGDLASTDLASRMGGGGRLRRHHVNRLGTVHAQSEDSLRAQLGKEVRATERELARTQNAIADREAREAEEAAAAHAAAGRAAGRAAAGAGAGWVSDHHHHHGYGHSPPEHDLSLDTSTSPSSHGSAEDGAAPAVGAPRASAGRGFAAGVARGGGGRRSQTGPGSPLTPEPHGEIGGGGGDDEWETVFREGDTVSPPGVSGGGALTGWEDPPTPPRLHHAGPHNGVRASPRSGAVGPGAARAALASSQAVQARLVGEASAFGDMLGVGEAWGGLLEELLAGDGAGGPWMSPRGGHSRSPVRGAPPCKSPSRSPVRRRANGGRASPVNRPGSPVPLMRERPARRL